MIQGLAEGSYDFNQTLTLLNDLMKDSKKDEWANVQLNTHFKQGRDAVALCAAAAANAPDYVSSNKRSKV